MGVIIDAKAEVMAFTALVEVATTIAGVVVPTKSGVPQQYPLEVH